MTLSAVEQQNIQNRTSQFWRSHARDTAFLEITRGKEVGHRIADYVDDRTTALLKVDFDTRYEADNKGLPRKRSMGDVWLAGSGIFNPVNVKAGLQDMNGQPNLVSMQKLLDYILNRWIDSYYLLIVKFSLGEQVRSRTVMVDMLDWLDFVAYDAGPGQIMLRERDFFDAVDNGHRPPARTMAQKVDSLFRRFEAGVEALVKNRNTRLKRQRKKFDDFGATRFVVDQSDISFVP